MFRSIRHFSTLSKLEVELNSIETVQFKDRYLEFQRQWKQLREQAKNEPPRIFNDKLDATQQKKLNLLSKHLEYLNLNEQRYLAEILRQKLAQTPDFGPSNMHLTEEEMETLNEGSWPMAHPQWLLQQETMAKLWPLGQQGVAQLFAEKVGFGGGSGGPAGSQNNAAPQAAQEAAPVKEEVKVEKTNFDVELSSIDAAQKIKIIKEVRQLFNLGLKEAKDMVEKAPVVMSKQMKAEDAQAMKKKLEEIGCTVNLI